MNLRLANLLGKPSRLLRAPPHEAAQRTVGIPLRPRTLADWQALPIIDYVKLRQGPKSQAYERATAAIVRIKAAGGWFRLPHYRNQDCRYLDAACEAELFRVAETCCFGELSR